MIYVIRDDFVLYVDEQFFHCKEREINSMNS